MGREAVLRAPTIENSVLQRLLKLFRSLPTDCCCDAVQILFTELNRRQSLGTLQRKQEQVRGFDFNDHFNLAAAGSAGYNSQRLYFELPPPLDFMMDSSYFSKKNSPCIGWTTKDFVLTTQGVRKEKFPPTPPRLRINLASLTSVRSWFVVQSKWAEEKIRTWVQR